MASANSQMSDNGNATPTQTTNSNAGNYGGINSGNPTTTSSATTAGNDLLERNPFQKTANFEDIVKLPYEIHRYSSYSTNYVPEFPFSGLRNDHIPETFNFRSEIAHNLPMLYIKIVPVLSWGPTFNYSIWYVELLGQDDPMYTSVCLKDYNKNILSYPNCNEFLVVKGDYEKSERFIADCIDEGLMDGYLDRQDYRHAWHEQPSKTITQRVRGGHQLVVDTVKHLIYLHGGWNGYQDLSDLWVYDIYGKSWTEIYEHSEQFNGPTPRSCHKMVFDPVSENIFMLGRYLDNSIRTIEYIKSDFFLFDTRAQTWLQICDDTSQVGGPQLIYDHQMCIDVDKRIIYVFGGKILTPRSVSASTSEPEYSGLFSVSYCHHTWNQILVDCHHPSASQPDVLSIKSRITHCMVFHNIKRKLYIYGGQRGKEDMHDFISYDVDTQSLEYLTKYPNNGQGGGSNSDNGNSNNSNNTDGKIEPPPVALRATIDCERDEIYVFSSLSKIKDRRDVMNTTDASNSFWLYSLETHTWSQIYSYRYTYPYPNAVTVLNLKEPCPRYAHQLVYDEHTKLHYLFGGNPGRAVAPQLRLDDFWILQLEKPRREEILKHCRYLMRRQCYEEMTQSDFVQAMQYLRTNVAEVIDHDNVEQLENFHKLATLLFKTEDVTDLEQSCLDNSVFSSSDLISLSTNEEESMSDHTEELPSESCANTSGSSDAASSYTAYRKLGGKLSRRDFYNKLRSKRSFLFNKLVKLMPSYMVQPERNLTDFVTV
ncbi:hypothetical protein DOY81_010628 [Sarcophaga bullata]|nr:hypothetical protein DOY81_010628 [Sarcophaga bullata]